MQNLWNFGTPNYLSRDKVVYSVYFETGYLVKERGTTFTKIRMTIYGDENGPYFNLSLCVPAERHHKGLVTDGYPLSSYVTARA